MTGKKIGRRELFRLLPGCVLAALAGLSAAMTTKQFDYFGAGHNYFNVTSSLKDQEIQSVTGIVNHVRNTADNVSIWVDPDYGENQVEGVLKALRDLVESGFGKKWWM